MGDCEEDNDTAEIKLSNWWPTATGPYAAPAPAMVCAGHRLPSPCSAENDRIPERAACRSNAGFSRHLLPRRREIQNERNLVNMIDFNDK